MLFLEQFLFFSWDYLAHKCCDDHISLPFPSSLVTLAQPLVGEPAGGTRVREFACVCMFRWRGFQPHHLSAGPYIDSFLHVFCPDPHLPPAHHLHSTKILVCAPYLRLARRQGPAFLPSGLSSGRRGAGVGGAGAERSKSGWVEIRYPHPELRKAWRAGSRGGYLSVLLPPQ